MATFNFNDLSSALEAESALRDSIRDATRNLEALQRKVAATLNGVHGLPESEYGSLLATAEVQLAEVRPAMAALSSLIAPYTFYKYNDMFSRTIQGLCFCTVLMGWLKSDTLITKEQCAEQIGIVVSPDNGMQLTTEEFLHGTITMISELSRLCQNAVTHASYTLPLRISKFVKELSAGFSLLNLKNDSLRRRFDAIKYDLKRCEETVYDISLRGLVKVDTSETPAKRTREVAMDG